MNGIVDYFLEVVVDLIVGGKIDEDGEIKYEN